MRKYRLSAVATELGLSRQRVYKMASAGIIKTRQNELGNYYITDNELDRLKKLQRKIGRPKK